MDATGHHRNVIYCRSKALSFQSLAPAPTTLVPATSPVQGCDLYGPANATFMRHTCNTNENEHFPCKFPSKVAAGAKIYIFHSKAGVGAANVKSCTLTVNLQVKSSYCMSCCMSCCMCVACQVRRIEQSRSQSGAPAMQKDEPVQPTTLRNQVKKVSRLSLYVFHAAQSILAHMRTCKQTEPPTQTHTHKHTHTTHTLSRQLVTRSCSIVDFVTSDDCGHQAWRDHLALWRYTYLGQANPVEQQEKLENSNGG